MEKAHFNNVEEGIGVGRDGDVKRRIPENKMIGGRGGIAAGK